MCLLWYVGIHLTKYIDTILGRGQIEWPELVDAHLQRVYRKIPLRMHASLNNAYGEHQSYNIYMSILSSIEKIYRVIPFLHPIPLQM